MRAERLAGVLDEREAERSHSAAQRGIVGG